MVYRDGTTGQAAATATGRDRNHVFIGQLHDGRYLFGRFREDDDFRRVEVNGIRFFIGLIGIELLRIDSHIVFAQKSQQFIE